MPKPRSTTRILDSESKVMPRGAVRFEKMTLAENPGGDRHWRYERYSRGLELCCGMECQTEEESKPHHPLGGGGGVSEEFCKEGCMGGWSG
jgi:hypothetical protein